MVVLTIEEIIKDFEKILTEKLKIKLEHGLTKEMGFLKDGLAMDSVMILEFIIELELLYDIEIDEDELTIEHFQKSISLAEFILDKVKAK